MHFTRSLLAISLALVVIGLALFLWQKQVEQYNFSYEDDSGLKEAFKQFEEGVRDYNIGATPPPEDIKFLEEWGAFQEAATGSTEEIFEQFLAPEESISE